MWYLYHNKFFGALIKKGKKNTAFKFFLKIKKALKQKEFFDPYYLFLVAMFQITPSLLIVPVKVGAAAKGVAFPLYEKRKITFAVKWILKLLKDKNGSVKVDSVVDLLYDSVYAKGLAVERKNFTHSTGLSTRYLLKKAFK
jgi:ribosomal protein S7